MTGSFPFSSEIEIVGFAARLRTFTEFCPVQIQNLLSTHTNQIGTKCARPSGRTVAIQTLRSVRKRSSISGVGKSLESFAGELLIGTKRYSPDMVRGMPSLSASDYADLPATLITDGLQFPEGPVVLPDGNLLVCEIKGQCITHVVRSNNGAWTKSLWASVPGGPNGAAIDQDGNVFVCNNGGSLSWLARGGLTYPGQRPSTYTGGRIERIDPATREITELYRTSVAADGTKIDLRGPNDLVLDGHGGMWFTDHGTRSERTADRTGIHYARIDGSSCAEVIFPVNEPNGIGLSPAGDRLWWAETHTGRIYSRTIVGPGVVGEPAPLNGLVAGLPGMQLLDSLAVDADGNACVATLIDSGITVCSIDGTVVKVRMPEEFRDPMVTNICFGGTDMRTAYITLSGTGRLISMPWPVAGATLN
jgi:gluconolactonase